MGCACQLVIKENDDDDDDDDDDEQNFLFLVCFARDGKLQTLIASVTGLPVLVRGGSVNEKSI